MASRRARTAGRKRRTNFGFNTDFNTTNAEVDIVRFKADIDILAAAGKQWTRMGVASWEVSTGGTTSTVTWDNTALAQYDVAVQYAYSHGIRIVMVLSGAPDWAQAFSDADYLTVTQIYWTALVNRWKQYVTVWQFFNEADTGHYSQFTAITTLDSTYLSKLNALLAAGRSIVKAAAPGAFFTTNTTGFPMGDARQAVWQTYFDALGGNLDIITLDLYADNDATEIGKLGTRVSSMRSRYGKPIAVAEFGMATGPNSSFTEADQQTYLPQHVASMKAGQPMMIILYELRDNSANISVDAEHAFGIIANDGTHKSGYTAIMNAMS
jgi:hypothetical protein